MSLLRLVHDLIKSLIVLCLPFILVGLSISTILGNAQLHKTVLKSSNFYTNLSQEIKNTSQNFTPDKGLTAFFALTALESTATPGWLQNFFEKNIDQLTDWLNGKTDDLNFYLPVNDIENGLYKELDTQTSNLSAKYKDQIVACPDATSKNIQREGFDVGASFCLPRDVRNNQQKLTEYLNFKKDNGTGILNSLVKDNYFTSFSNYFKLNSIIQSEGQSQLNFLTRVRNGYLFGKKIIWYLFAGFLILLIAELVLAVILKKKMFKEISNLFWLISSSTILLAATIILVVGGSTYLTSSVQNYILSIYGLNNSKVINLLSFEVLKFSISLVSIALLVAISMLGFNFLVLILQKSGLFQAKTGKKLQKIRPSTQKAPVKPVNDGTFNGEFERMRQTDLSSPKANQPQQSYLNKSNPNNFSNQPYSNTQSNTNTTYTNNPTNGVQPANHNPQQVYYSQPANNTSAQVQNPNSPYSVNNQGQVFNNPTNQPNAAYSQNNPNYNPSYPPYYPDQGQNPNQWQGNNPSNPIYGNTNLQNPQTSNSKQGYQQGQPPQPNFQPPFAAGPNQNNPTNQSGNLKPTNVNNPNQPRP